MMSAAAGRDSQEMGKREAMPDSCCRQLGVHASPVPDVFRCLLHMRINLIRQKQSRPNPKP